MNYSKNDNDKLKTIFLKIKLKIKVIFNDRAILNIKYILRMFQKIFLISYEAKVYFKNLILIRFIDYVLKLMILTIN